MRDRSLSLFSFQFDIAFNLLFISTFLQIVNMQDTPHQMKDFCRKYCFSSLDLCRKPNLKNIALTWATLEKNNKLDTF